MKTPILLALTIFISLISIIDIQAQKKEKPDPEMIEAYFTDKDNNRLGEDISLTHSDGYIYMYLVTRNAIGEKVTIDLDDDDTGYIFKREYLTANSKIKFKIKNDLNKIKLVIFNPNKKKHLRIKARTFKKSNE